MASLKQSVNVAGSFNLLYLYMSLANSRLYITFNCRFSMCFINVCNCRSHNSRYVRTFSLRNSQQPILVDDMKLFFPRQ